MDLFTNLLQFQQKKQEGWRINEFSQLIKEYLIELLEECQQLNFIYVIIFVLLIVYKIWIRRVKRKLNVLESKQKKKNELISEALQTLCQSRLDNKNKDNINSLTICDKNNLIDLCQSLKDYNIEPTNADCKNETDRLLLLDLVDKGRKLKSKPLRSNIKTQSEDSTTTTTSNSRRSIGKMKTVLTNTLVNAVKNHDIEWSQSRTKFKNAGTTTDESSIINKYKKRTFKQTNSVENLKKLSLISMTNVYKCQSDCGSINLMNTCQQQQMQSQTQLQSQHPLKQQQQQRQTQQFQTEEDQQQPLKIIKSKVPNKKYKSKIPKYIGVLPLIPMQQIEELATVSGTQCEQHENATIDQQHPEPKMKNEAANTCKKHRQYHLPKCVLPSDLQQNKN